jgi:acetoacetyl-CoA synthetase
MFTPHEDRTRGSNMARFVARCEGIVGRSLADYAALQRFAMEEARMFWRLLLEHCEIVHGGDASVVLEGDDVQTARFFPGVTLNYTENLLRVMSPEVEASVAVVYRGEDGARLEPDEHRGRRVGCQHLTERPRIAGARLFAEV